MLKLKSWLGHLLTVWPKTVTCPLFGSAYPSVKWRCLDCLCSSNNILCSSNNIILLKWGNYPHSVNLIKTGIFKKIWFLLYPIPLQKVSSKVWEGTTHVHNLFGLPDPHYFPLLLYCFIVTGIYSLNSSVSSFLSWQGPMHITQHPSYPDNRNLYIFSMYLCDLFGKHWGMWKNCHVTMGLQ